MLILLVSCGPSVGLLALFSLGVVVYQFYEVVACSISLKNYTCTF